MKNGDSIGLGRLTLGNYCKSNGRGSSPLTQSNIALPGPRSDSIYYLLYVDLQSSYYDTTFTLFGLNPLNIYYAKIDMSKEGGLGEVVEKNKLILNDTLPRAMMTATRHANGEDWWIVYPQSLSNCYYIILLTENGVDTVFKQCLGHVWSDKDNQGQATFSPNGKKYARYYHFNGLNLFDFEAATGLFSNPFHTIVDSDTAYFGGTAFSSNSRFLYTALTGVNLSRVYQFDTQAPDISASRTLVGTLPPPPLGTQRPTFFNNARLAYDGKIYIAGVPTYYYLHTINNPNCPGLACNFQAYSVPLVAESWGNIPNQPHYRQWSEAEGCTTSTPEEPLGDWKQQVIVAPNPSDDQINITLPMTMEGRALLVDPLGRIVLEQPFAADGLFISVRHLPNGIYTLELRTRKGMRSVHKVVVAH